MKMTTMVQTVIVKGVPKKTKKYLIKMYLESYKSWKGGGKGVTERQTSSNWSFAEVQEVNSRSLSFSLLFLHSLTLSLTFSLFFSPSPDPDHHSFITNWGVAIRYGTKYKQLTTMLPLLEWVRASAQREYKVKSGILNKFYQKEKNKNEKYFFYYCHYVPQAATLKALKCHKQR